MVGIMYISAPTLILLGILAIMVIPALRKLLKGTLGGLELTTHALNDSMKMGAMSILASNQKQLRAIEREIDALPPGKTADEILNQLLKMSQPS